MKFDLRKFPLEPLNLRFYRPPKTRVYVLPLLFLSYLTLQSEYPTEFINDCKAVLAIKAPDTTGQQKRGAASSTGQKSKKQKCIEDE